MGNGKGPKIEDTDFILLHITIFLMQKKNLGGNISLLKSPPQKVKSFIYLKKKKKTKCSSRINQYII